MAGQRAGTDDDRYLWPECIRTVREVKPQWCVFENVPGLINWDGGLVFEQVQADLENEGYEVTPFVLPASGVNAPHRRDRVWFVGYRHTAYGNTAGERDTTFREVFTEGAGNKESADTIGVCEFTENPNSSRIAQSELQYTDLSTRSGGGNEQTSPHPRLLRPEIGQLDTMGVDELCEQRDAADTPTIGMERNRPSGEQVTRTHAKEGVSVCGGAGQTVTYPEPTGRERPIGIRQPIRFKPGTWDNWPTVEPTICCNNDGLSYELVGITVPKHRNESIKGYGNAIVPQVVFQIFKAIEQFDNANKQ
jgi:DNA (cytosine-5)-methyltransferase 1